MIVLEQRKKALKQNEKSDSSDAQIYNVSIRKDVECISNIEDAEELKTNQLKNIIRTAIQSSISHQHPSKLSVRQASADQVQ